MPCIFPGLLLLPLLLSAGAVEPIPEADQAAKALLILNAYHGERPAHPPKQLHVVYFTPADREPAARYEERLEAILEDIQGFYRDGMERAGFKGSTFPLPRDEEGSLIIHLVKGTQPASAFPRWSGRNGGNTGAPEAGAMVQRECAPVLKAAGISFESETVLIFCHLASWDAEARTFGHHSPYFGFWNQQSGLCFAADWANQDLANLTKEKPLLYDAEYGEMSLGRHTTIFIGGIAHELGHAFALPHCGERWDEQRLGTSLMGAGNHTYREELRGEGKGSFLAMASALRLAGRPLFNQSDKGMNLPPELDTCTMTLSTNVSRSDLAGRRGALRLEGVVRGTPPLYGVVAYFDSAQDGGYRAPTATGVPNEQGEFAIEVSDLAPSANAMVRVEFCHVNGAVSERRLSFRIGPDGAVDLAEWELRQALEPVNAAVARNDLAAARTSLADLNSGGAPPLAQLIARKLVATLQGGQRTPEGAPMHVTELALGDAQATQAEVGWLEPAANRIPPNTQVPSPLLDSGRLYATGLYAHAPARHVYRLGGKWKELSGEAGLHTLQQPYGSVRFIIRADGKEVFRSATIRGNQKAHYRLSMAGVKELELLVDPTANGNGNDWGLWLEPVLTR